MKKTAAILTVLILMFSMSSFAISGTDYPVWDGASAPADSLYGSIGGQSLLMDFDSDAEYSNVADGLAQLCFFAFDEAEQNYLEMYLLLPENAAAGDVFSPTGGGMCSVSLYEVSKDSDVLYFSGQVAGFAYPSGSSFELRIESAQRSASALSMRGVLDGTLVKFDGDAPTRETLVLTGVHFDFTLPLAAGAAPKASAAPQQSAQPEASAQPVPSAAPQLPVPSTAPQLPVPSTAPQLPAPKAPQPTLDPHPAFTLPPDYAVL